MNNENEGLNKQQLICQLPIIQQQNENSQNRRQINRIPSAILEQMEYCLDMDYIVSDWQFAESHGKATNVGFIKQHIQQIQKNEKKKQSKRQQQKQYQKCICCLNHIDKQQIPLCCNTKNLKFLGSGFPLFYIFLKSILLQLLLLIASYTILQLYWTISQNYNFCYGNPRALKHDDPEVKCTSYMILFANISLTITNEQKVLRISSFVTLLIFLLFQRDNFTKILQYYDEKSTTYSDFSILFLNLPNKRQISQDLNLKGKKIGTILRQFLQDRQLFSQNCYSQDGSFNIKNMMLIPQDQQLQKQIENRKKAINQLKQIKIKIKNINTQKIEQLQKRQLLIKSKQSIAKAIKISNTKIRGQKKHLKEQMDIQDVDCDKAIISFQFQEERIQIQEQFLKIQIQKLKKYFGVKYDQLQLNRAPEPNQIIWHNIHISGNQQKKHKLVSWFIFILILGGVTTGFYFIKIQQSHLIQNQMKNKQGQITDHSASHRVDALIYGSIVFIIIFNKFILTEIIHHLVIFERHKTQSSLEFSFCLKYTLGLFFTTALMTLLVQGVTTNNIYKEDYGVVEQQTIMYFFNSFIVPAIWLINPWHIAKWIKRKIYYGTFNMTQREANKLMENPEYIIGKRYGEVLENVWFTYLYVCIIPAGSVLMFIGMSLFYWIDKYNLLRRSSIIQSVGGKLVLNALNLLDFVLIFKPAGELIFDNWLRKDWAVVSVIQLCVGVIYVCLPTNDILQYLNPQDFESSLSTYDVLVLNKNILNYQFYNPYTRLFQLVKFQDFFKNITIQNKQLQGQLQKGNNQIVNEGELPLSAKRLFNQQVNYHNVTQLNHKKIAMGNIKFNLKSIKKRIKHKNTLRRPSFSNINNLQTEEDKFNQPNIKIIEKSQYTEI